MNEIIVILMFIVMIGIGPAIYAAISIVVDLILTVQGALEEKRRKEEEERRFIEWAEKHMRKERFENLMKERGYICE